MGKEPRIATELMTFGGQQIMSWLERYNASVGDLWQGHYKKAAIVTVGISFVLAILVIVNPGCLVSGESVCTFAWQHLWEDYKGKGIALQLAGAGVLYAATIFGIRVTADSSKEKSEKRLQRIDMCVSVGYLLAISGLYYDLFEENIAIAWWIPTLIAIITLALGIFISIKGLVVIILMSVSVILRCSKLIKRMYIIAATHRNS